jgi:methylenetetrahydrofolate reductase (NADPH)
VKYLMSIDNRDKKHEFSGGTPSMFAYSEQDIKVSFEFFPPKTPKMEETLWSSVERLAPLHPEFVSVTYGAGGTTRERTHATIKRILLETDLTPAAHLTCVGASRGEVDDILREYWDMGVRNIVALRGDPAEGEGKYAPHSDGYENAADLVAGIRKIGAFDISVAAYPEQHPESPNLVGDLENLKRKVDAGADRAITQFFFEPDQYFRFLDHAHSFGINVPIVPGILPVTNVAQLQSFAASCGAKVPDWMTDIFEGLDDHPTTRQLVSATVASEMCQRLANNGVRNFHFYTLNRADLSYAISHMLGLRPSSMEKNK